MLYARNTVYVTGTARIAANDPIAALFDVFFIGIILDKESGKIIDLTCNMVKDTTINFIKSMLLDYRLVEDIDQIADEIKNRFHGMAQKTVIAAVKDARNKYIMLND